MLERRRLCARTGKRSLIGKPLRHRCALLYGLSQLSGEGGDLLACAALRKIGKRLRTGMPQQVDLLVHQAELIGKRAAQALGDLAEALFHRRIRRLSPRQAVPWRRAIRHRWRHDALGASIADTACKPPQPASPAPQTTKTKTAGVARNAMHAATAMTTQPETATKHTQRQVSGSKAMPAHRSRSLDRSRSLIESGAKPASASTARDHKRAGPA